MIRTKDYLDKESINKLNLEYKTLEEIFDDFKLNARSIPRSKKNKVIAMKEV